VGFDWPNIEGVLNKLDEEMREFREALSLQDRRKIREEIGDILFVMANVSRFLQIDPEEALKKTIDKFVSRFRYIETSLQRQKFIVNLIEMDRHKESKRKRKVKFTTGPASLAATQKDLEFIKMKTDDDIQLKETLFGAFFKNYRN
jgi:uncharacterized protein YabN with tetrapyrrole methylase and pyrophosphatase domain